MTIAGYITRGIGPGGTVETFLLRGLESAGIAIAGTPAYDDVLVAMASLIATGGDAAVMIGEPKGPPAIPEGKVFVTVSLERQIVHVIMLSGSTIETHIVRVRLYERFLDEDGRGELNLYAATQRVISKLVADADLGGLVRHIDAAGIYGDHLSGELGYASIAGTMFHVCDVTVPLLVDDAQTIAI